MGNDQNHSLNRLMDNDPDQPTVVQRLKSAAVNKFLELASKKWGALVQYGVGAVGGYLTTTGLAALTGTLGNLGIVLTAEETNTLYNFIASLQEVMAMVGILVMGFVTQWVQTKANMKVQKRLGTKPDGWIGPQTIRCAEIVADNATPDTSKL